MATARAGRRSGAINGKLYAMRGPVDTTLTTNQIYTP